jgi:sulfopyruvate decarboxylase TPP-binding subunit
MEREIVDVDVMDGGVTATCGLPSRRVQPMLEAVDLERIVNAIAVDRSASAIAIAIETAVASGPKPGRSEIALIDGPSRPRSQTRAEGNQSSRGAV